MWIEACFARSTGRPSMALSLGVAHPLFGELLIMERKNYTPRHLHFLLCCWLFSVPYRNGCLYIDHVKSVCLLVEK